MLKFIPNIFYSLIIFFVTNGSTVSDIVINNNINAICTTVYHIFHWDQLPQDKFTIEPYLWSNNTHKLLFRATSPNNQIIRAVITIASVDATYSLQYVFTDNIINTINLKSSYKQVDDQALKSLTKTIDNVPYDSVLWTSWDLYHTNDAFTYFRGGVGSTFDNFSSKYSEDWPLKPNEIETAYLFDFNEINNTQWQFYHDLCQFRIDLYIVSRYNVEANTVFAISDYIHLNPTLWHANTLNVPIHITSEDILDVHHTLHLNESNQCMICPRKSDHICTDCAHGIRITELTTYDIHSNAYTLKIYTDNDSRNVLRNGETIFEFTRKIQNVSIQTDYSVRIGRSIPIYLQIQGDEIYQPYSVIHVYNHALGVDHTIHLSYDTSLDSALVSNCTIMNQHTNITRPCHQGIGPIQTNNQSQTNQFMLRLTTNDTYLVHNEIPVFLERTYVRYNHWIGIESAGEEDSICPNDQCCKDINGCFYYSRHDESITNESDHNVSDHLNGYVCAYHRNHTVPLCGSCDTGYAEVFNAAQCRACDTDHYEYLGLPILIAFAVLFVLILFDTTMYATHSMSPSPQQRETLMIHDETEGILIVIFRVFIVNLQSMNYILWQAGYTFWGTALIQLLSLDSYLWFWISSDHDIDGVCFLRNLTAMQYHLWYLYFPLCLMMVLFIYLLIKATCCRSQCWCTPCDFGGYTVWNLVLIILFHVLITFMILLSCHSIDDEYGSVHFYAAGTECYGTEFLITAFFSLVLVFVCIWFYIMIKRMDPSIHSSVFWKDNASCLRGIARPYKSQCWYFEFIMIIRRMVLVICITLQYVHRIAMHVIVLIVLLLLGLIELKCDPFKYKRAMYMDLVCLISVSVSLIVMIVNINNNFFYDESAADHLHMSNEIGNMNHMNMSQMNGAQAATMISISITIIVPIVLLLWNIIYAVWSCCSIRNNLQESNEPMKRRMEQMKQRSSEWTGMDDKVSSPLYIQRIQTSDDDDADEPILPKMPTTLIDRILNAENDESKSTYYTKPNATVSTVIETMDDYSEDDHELVSMTDSTTFSPRKHAHTEMALVGARKGHNKANGMPLKRDHTLKMVREEAEIESHSSVSKHFKRETKVSRLVSNSGNNHESSTALSSFSDTFSSRPVAKPVPPPKKKSDKSDKYQSVDSDVTVSDHEDQSDSDSEGEQEDVSLVDAVDNAFNPIETQPQNTVDTDSDDSELHGELEKLMVEVFEDTPSKGTGKSKSGEAFLGSPPADGMNKERGVHIDDNSTDEDTKIELPMPMPMLLQDNKSITLSIPSQSAAQVFHPAKSYRNQNTPDNENGYQYEYMYHEAPVWTEETKQNPVKHSNKRPVPKPPERSFKRVTKLKPQSINTKSDPSETNSNKMPVSPMMGNQSFLRQHTATYSVGSRSRQTQFRTANAQNVRQQRIKEESKTPDSVSSTEFESVSYTTTSMDSERERRRWNAYGDNLRKLFVCFAGCHPQTTTRGLFMSLSQVKMFLDMVLITKYWSVDQVLEVMHRQENDDLTPLRVSATEFVQYFCNVEVNPTIKDIKKHIEKQVSWKWMLKSLQVFERIDVDGKGYLNAKQFVEFTRSYNWDATKADALFQQIDAHKTGQITITQLFNWFLKGFEAAKQRNKRKHKNQTDSHETWSGTHSSFYDNSVDTRSVTTHQTAQTNETTEETEEW